MVGLSKISYSSTEEIEKACLHEWCFGLEHPIVYESLFALGGDLLVSRLEGEEIAFDGASCQ